MTCHNYICKHFALHPQKRGGLLGKTIMYELCSFHGTCRMNFAAFFREWVLPVTITEKTWHMICIDQPLLIQQCCKSISCVSVTGSYNIF